MNFEIIKLRDNKNHYSLTSDGCLYKIYRTRETTKYLCCIEKRCKCLAKIENGLMTRTNENEHTHTDGHTFKAEYENEYKKLKEQILKDRRPLRVMHHEIQRGMTLQASGLFNWSRVRRTLQRIRQKVMPPCSDLKSFIGLFEENDEIYNNYGKIRGTEFYHGAIDDEIVIFANLEIVSKLENDFTMCIDATFNVSPFYTHQLLIILAVIMGKPRPIVYAIMSGRSKQNYIDLLVHVRDAVLSSDGKIRKPKRAMADFEKGMRSALTEVFIDIELDGCNFHLLQAMHRKAASLNGLSTKLNGKTLHHLILVMFMRLSLLPIDRLMAGFDALKEYIESKPQIASDYEEFMLYFHRTWIIRFSPTEWCVGNQVFRTNNNIEGYNRFVKRTIPRNPSPWQFLDGLLDLSFDASSSLQADEVRPSQLHDRSKLSEPLRQSLIKLNKNEINELDFLKFMARIN